VSDISRINCSMPECESYVYTDGRWRHALMPTYCSECLECIEKGRVLLEKEKNDKIPGVEIRMRAKSDLVRLVTGGPVMIVASDEADFHVECQWFEGDILREATFHYKVLTGVSRGV